MNTYLLVRIDTRDLQDITIQKIGIFFEREMADEIKEREDLSDDEPGIIHEIFDYYL